MDNEALVEVHATLVNPLDWHCLRDTPLLLLWFQGCSNQSKSNGYWEPTFQGELKPSAVPRATTSAKPMTAIIVNPNDDCILGTGALHSPSVPPRPLA